MFIDILNGARIGELSDKDADVLNCWKGDAESVLTQAPVIFAKYSPKDSYNRSKLDSLSEVDIEIYAIDEVPQETLIENLHTKSQSSTGGLAYCLHLKKGAQVMLTVNIDLTDRLVSGQIVIVYSIAYTESQISKVMLNLMIH